MMPSLQPSEALACDLPECELASDCGYPALAMDCVANTCVNTNCDSATQCCSHDDCAAEENCEFSTGRCLTEGALRFTLVWFEDENGRYGTCVFHKQAYMQPFQKKLIT